MKPVAIGSAGRGYALIFATLFLASPPSMSAASEELRLQAAEAIRRSVLFFRHELSTQGSYVWSYSLDLKSRWGEGPATETQGWVQPPGTPAVGMAYLSAFEATRAEIYLDAATAAARALAWTQLASGGWDYLIEFDPEKSRKWHYRRNLTDGDTETGARRNSTVFDDNNTQAALQLLMHVDAALGGKDPHVRQAVEYGLAKLLEAQYPNGAWPQQYTGARRNTSDTPLHRARYPKAWPRAFAASDYRQLYTFNDGAISDAILTLLEAHRIYRGEKYIRAAKLGGDFVVRAQMPHPQPVWGQQYNREMEPTWGRKFEPPSVASWESAGLVRTLLALFEYTREEKYKKSAQMALEWFKRSRSSEGVWARFYELESNRPLYFDSTYRLVHTDHDLPPHYSFKGDYGISELLRLCADDINGSCLAKFGERNQPSTAEERRRSAIVLERSVRETIAALDGRGRWIEGERINSATFISNVHTLAAYISAVQDPIPGRKD